MGRPKKVRESTGKEFRTDRELVSQWQEYTLKASKALKKETKLAHQNKANLAAYELWDKYFKLRMKMKHQLIALCQRNNIYMQEDIEEYDSEAWQEFIKQMPGVRLEDVEHLPNWSIYIRLWGYWRSMNRNILKRWFDWKNNTTPIFISNENNETFSNLDKEIARHGDLVDHNLHISKSQTILWESFDILKNKLSQKEKQLLNMKVQGKKNREIMSTLQINGRILKENLDRINGQLDLIIQSTSKKHGADMNYSELVASLEG